MISRFAMRPGSGYHTARSRAKARPSGGPDLVNVEQSAT